MIALFFPHLSSSQLIPLGLEIRLFQQARWFLALLKIKPTYPLVLNDFAHGHIQRLDGIGRIISNKITLLGKILKPSFFVRPWVCV